MQCHFIFFKRRQKNSAWKYQMARDIPLFMFCYQIYLIIKKIKAKFLVGENKYMCGYCKIIWIPSLKCNTHMQIHFKIIDRWFKQP
jgi:hypothetical protein